MSSLIQFRRDTSANWTTANPILAEGELGLETDTNAYKIGNGTDTWAALPYNQLTGEFETMLMNGVLTEPSLPSAGNMFFYAKSIGGRMMPKWKGPAGVDVFAQPSFSGNSIIILTPNTTTSFSYIGPGTTNVGTVAHPTISAASFKAAARRATVVSAATSNSASDIRYAVPICMRGDAAGVGGFFCVIRFGIDTTVANQRGFFGLVNSTSAISTSQVTNALTNCIGVGWDSGDTTMSIMHNDGAGNCTKVALGVDFPTILSDTLFELVLFAAPNDDKVSWRMTDLESSVSESGVITDTTQLPLSTTTMQPRAYMNNGGTAAAIRFDLARIYIETDN